MKHIKKITFDEILFYWKLLWPERKTPIEPSNPLQFMGSIDMELKEVVPTFFGYFVDNRIVGVNSGLKTHDLLYRSRGIWVHKDYRKNYIGSELLKAVVDQSIKERCSYIWSIPRYSSYNFYKNNGFTRCSKWLDVYEFGPNCFVLKKGNYV